MAIRPQLVVVMYHYVRDDSARTAGIKACGLKRFERQIEHLQSRFEMATLDAALAFLSGWYHPARDICLLTFDDGLMDHYSNAFPILERNQIPGLFFLTTSCLNGQVASVHKSHLLMTALGFSRYRGAFLEELRHVCPATESDVTTEEARRAYRWDSDEVAAFKYLVNFTIRGDVRDRVLKRLLSSHLGEESAIAEQLYLGWNEARKMQESGMVMGGHSHLHVPLTQLDADEQKDDLRTCAAILRANLHQQSVWPFSYPFGKAGSFDETSTGRIRDAGFDCAFSTIVGSNGEGQGFYSIRRYDTKDVPRIAGAAIQRPAVVEPR